MNGTDIPIHVKTQMKPATFEIPTKQRAAVRQGSGREAKTVIKEIDVPTPGPGEILVKISWSGLCASDKSLLRDDWAAFQWGMQDSCQGIAGHEGAGVVVSVGPGMETKWNIGDRAGIKWIYSTCGECYLCRNGGDDELHCPNKKHPGFNQPGTFQEYALSDGRYTTKIPEGVTDEEAGPIMCGGVTAYVACKRSGVQPGQWIIILGAGGGLGHFAVQYARVMGMRVIAVDGGDEKAEFCKELGAEAFIDFKKTPDVGARVHEITTHGAHAVIVFPAGKETYSAAPTYLRVGGTLVAIGLAPDPTAVAGAHPMLVIGNRLTIQGSTTRTLKDVDEALEFTVRGLVRPVLTKGKLEDLDSLCEQLASGQLKGRAVLSLAS